MDCMVDMLAVGTLPPNLSYLFGAKSRHPPFVTMYSSISAGKAKSLPIIVVMVPCCGVVLWCILALGLSS